MKASLIGLLTETMVHPGSGQNNGAIDLPVARESTTGYPVAVGSSMKGALRDKADQEKWEDVKELFGDQKQAGEMAVSDARLLLLPVRSLQGLYRWVTCPYILERLQRDARLAGKPISLHIPEVGEGDALVEEGLGTLFLEELSFDMKAKSKVIQEWAEEIEPLIGHDQVRERLKKQLAVVSDHDFAYLARYSLPVHIRNQLDKNKTSKNLWSEETLPPDTLLYTLLIPRPGREMKGEEIERRLKENPYIQIGGNETLGQGWCMIAIAERGES
ncbi:type III-B CRISPR module RAMP protein Cmr4 [Kroppenstedtia pulmonis]|uniref:Type III-B CRISPR module RAMP protein Cmr4 n=1 Tax=Kroppenstedtia pulmonis TaxID=1380685 RepID=A0A7D3XHL1_9BACL|nr:type III-B CRISPR module RAMP protein Cmr4 [Kroppenstedtia pulmonis]QKG83299.1 type III-B CRISPR module RAMP protein Cmr4 [Kroppenstedtia pulmonis]